MRRSASKQAQTIILLCSAVFLLVACAAPAPAKPSADEVAHFVVSGGGRPLKVTAGGVATVAVRAVIDSGWQIYSLTQKSGGPTPLVFGIEPSPPFTRDGPIKGPSPKIKRDATFGVDTEIYDEAPTFVIPIRISSSASAGRQTLKLQIRSQACSDIVCLEPTTTSIDVPVVVAER